MQRLCENSLSALSPTLTFHGDKFVRNILPNSLNFASFRFISIYLTQFSYFKNILPICVETTLGKIYQENTKTHKQIFSSNYVKQSSSNISKHSPVCVLICDVSVSSLGFSWAELQRQTSQTASHLSPVQSELSNSCEPTEVTDS